jgi:hypothetical protein
VASGWVTSCEVRASDAPKLGAQKAISVYTEAELDLLRLMARARGNLRFWVLVETLIETGRRISERLSIRWLDVKLDSCLGGLAQPQPATGNKSSRGCHQPVPSP